MRITSFLGFAKKSTRPIKTIEREMEITKAKYDKYLKTRTDNFIGKKSNVTIKDPHTMAGDSYFKIRENINEINKAAKMYNKEVTFEDARTLTKDMKSPSIALNNKLMNSILITSKDKTSGIENTKIIDVFENQDKEPLLKKIINALGELFTNKKGSNIDSELIG